MKRKRRIVFDSEYLFEFVGRLGLWFIILMSAGMYLEKQGIKDSIGLSVIGLMSLFWFLTPLIKYFLRPNRVYFR